MQKIYGLDWHPQRMYELLTCSEDKTVKFWDVTQPRVSQGILTTGAPVWRAQYTPFGDGLVTISQRVDNTLRLWALSHGDGNENGGNGAETDPSGANSASSVTAELVHSFVGHGDLVKGMAWRVRPQTGMYQLVSWSKDQELRLWRVNAPQLEACGYDTASYLADAVPSEGGNGNGLQPEDLRLLRAEFEEMHMPQSKYNMLAVKADFVPLVVPKSAVPLSTEEYTLEGNDSSLQALLALEEELIKGGEPQSQSPAGSDDENSPLEGERVDGKMDASPGTKERAASAGGARALPCPRISGACFSGPNMLLVFDSRVAIGQSRNSAVIPTTVAAGKVIKPQVAPNKLPRTYEELLDLRDSRFATKKNKKPPVKLLSSSNILGAMDLAANEWAGQQQQELIDGGGGIGVFSDDVENHSGASHGFRTSSMFYSSGSGSGGNDGIGASGGEMDMSIHGGSEYLKTYFSSAEYHLPVNHPEHLLSVPTSATPGLALSPRASTIRANNAERSKRVEQAAPVLNLDLSLSVTILDLSKLCGVSSILTYQTDLAPRDVTPAALLPNSSAAKRRRGQLGSVNRSMVSWMLRASEQMSRKHGVASENYLGRVLQELSAGKDGVAPNPAEDEENAGLDEADALLAATCAQNARVALLAGRNDLQQIWSLLEISTAPAVELPIYKKNGSNASSLLELTTRHPWSAHPFGKRLVHKVLGMYEQVGDVQALASIVCVLKPSERKERQDLLDPAASSALAMEEHFVKVSGSKNASGGDVLSEAIDSTAAAGSNDGLRPPSRRSSSNALSQLTGNFADLGDTPPAMRSTRRSISHSDIAHFQSGDRLAVDKDAAALRPSRDWPLVAGSSGSTATSSRFSSPIRENVDPSITISTRSRETPTKASAQVGSSGWKMDFERLENPFKTWSGNSSAKDLSPPRISAEMFQRPVQPTSGASPATTTMAMTLSPRITPIPPSPLLSSSVPSIEEEDVNPNDRMQLQLIFRSVDDEKCLLSSLPEDEARYDVYKEAYAEVLYRYGAMDLRNEVLKTMSHSSQEAGGVTMGLVCSSCNAVRAAFCCSIAMGLVIAPKACSRRGC
ncbi:hypothetical protein BBJ28_00025235 [Nothophytophthora sp. Chile5]|nr:hypothetical protein BBJ28_00025235 [Nothophytophthora sp. Chile5]